MLASPIQDLKSDLCLKSYLNLTYNCFLGAGMPQIGLLEGKILAIDIVHLKVDSILLKIMNFDVKFYIFFYGLRSHP